MIKLSAINLKSPELATAFYSIIVAGLFSFLSFYDTDAENYLFPRIIAIALMGFSVILLIINLQASQALAKDSTDDNKGNQFFKILPGLIIGIIYMALMDIVGFYTSSFLAFLSFLLLYGKREMLDPKAFVKKVTVSVGFVFVLYLLFWQGLYVRTPTGWLF
jgi:hypothetical protein